jgi:hypothetical protein
MNPKHQEEIVLKMAQPYMGMHEGKLWDNTGMLGRVIGPLEDYYLDYVKHRENVPSINKVLNL